MKEGKRGDQAGICASGKSQKKRQFTQVEFCPGESTVQATYWVPQSWDPTQRRGALLSDWRAWDTNKWAVRSLDSTWEEVAYAYLHLKQGREDRLKLWWRLTGFL